MVTSMYSIIWAFIAISKVKCDFGAYKSIDLTHTQDENSIGWPGYKGKLFTRKSEIKGYSEEFGYPDQ